MSSSSLVVLALFGCLTIPLIYLFIGRALRPSIGLPARWSASAKAISPFASAIG